MNNAEQLRQQQLMQLQFNPRSSIQEWNNLKESLQSLTTPNIIWSSENLYSLWQDTKSIDYIYDFFHSCNFKIHPIIHLMQQDEYALCLYEEAIQRGSVVSFNRFLNNIMQHKQLILQDNSSNTTESYPFVYQLVLDAWRFSERGSILVYNQSPENILKHFFRSANVNPERLHLHNYSHRRNDRELQIELLIKLGESQFPFSNKQKEMAFQILRKGHFLNNKEFDRFTAESKNTFISLFTEDNLQLSSRYNLNLSHWPIGHNTTPEQFNEQYQIPETTLRLYLGLAQNRNSW